MLSSAHTAWKVSRYGVFSGPYFPVFGLNTGIYGQEKTPYLDTFHAVPYKGICWPAKILSFYCIMLFDYKIKSQFSNLTLRKRRPYSELFWSVFSRIRTEYGEIRSISPYSVRMRENVDQNNSEYWHLLRSVTDLKTLNFLKNFFDKTRHLFYIAFGHKCSIMTLYQTLKNLDLLIISLSQKIIL